MSMASSPSPPNGGKAWSDWWQRLAIGLCSLLILVFGALASLFTSSLQARYDQQEKALHEYRTEQAIALSEINQAMKDLSTSLNTRISLVAGDDTKHAEQRQAVVSALRAEVWTELERLRVKIDTIGYEQARSGGPARLAALEESITRLRERMAQYDGRTPDK